MASINGITLKNLKTFDGKEGEGFSASIYLDNKKIGTVVDSAYGGCYDYDFEVGKYNVFLDKVKEHYRKHPCVDNFKIFNCSVEEFLEIKDNLPFHKVDDMLEIEDTFIYDLKVLTDFEKIYKKNLKKNRSVMIVLDAYSLIGRPTPLCKILSCNETYDYSKDIKEHTDKYPTGYATIYKRIEDFVI